VRRAACACTCTVVQITEGAWADLPQAGQAMRKAVSVLYNASGDAACYNATQLQGPAGPGATWLFQWCTQRSAQELPYFPANGAGRGAKPCPPGTPPPLAGLTCRRSPVFASARRAGLS